MPSIVWIRVVEARDLPVMNQSTKSADACECGPRARAARASRSPRCAGRADGEPCLRARASRADVEVSFAGRVMWKTETVRNSLCPKWRETHKFEVVDDAELQDSPLQLTVMDKDRYSADDAIGVVNIDLNTLLMRRHDHSRSYELDGWFPVYDTLRGVCGELHIVVKLEHVQDQNRFDDSTTGMQFFAASALCPHALVVHEILGFVEVGRACRRRGPRVGVT